MRPVSLLILLAAFGMPAPDATAQSDPAGTAASPFAVQLRQNSRLRVQAGQRTLEGVLIRQESDALVLTGATGPVPLREITGVWVRGRSTATGAIVGGVAGGLGFGLFLATVVSATCESSTGCQSLEAGLFGGVLGAAGGALVGAAIGAVIPRWRKVWPGR